MSRETVSPAAYAEYAQGLAGLGRAARDGANSANDSGPMVRPPARMAPLSIAFFSSRTFPGQGYSMISFSAAGERTHSWAETWLAWNLILAWVPYVASLWALSAHLRRPHRPWLLLVPGALWLIFLPNAPYIVTDFVNLSLHRADHWVFWYDTVQLAIFAWTGCILGVTSLSIMQSLVRAFAGRVVMSNTTTPQLPAGNSAA